MDRDMVLVAHTGMVWGHNERRAHSENSRIGRAESLSLDIGTKRAWKYHLIPRNKDGDY